MTKVNNDRDLEKCLVMIALSQFKNKIDNCKNTEAMEKYSKAISLAAGRLFEDDIKTLYKQDNGKDVTMSEEQLARAGETLLSLTATAHGSDIEKDLGIA